MVKLIPREYQKTIFENIKNNNSLVSVPTSLGKTLIAFMLAEHQLELYPNKKVLFLAPTRPLCNQHFESFNQFKSVVMNGLIKQSDRFKLYQENEVIFVTPQCITSDIKKGLDLNMFSLIIFDEAHRSIGDYAYVKIAEKYSKIPNHLILGMTASPGGNKAKIKEVCDNLHLTHVESRTNEDEDVKPYIQKTIVETTFIDLPDELKAISKKLKELFDSDLNGLKK